MLLLSKLEHWLRQGARGQVPSATGIWGDIYHHLYRLKKVEKKRKKSLGKIIDRFQKSTNMLPDAAIVLGDNKEIEWSNKLAKQVLGIKKSDKGQRINNLIRSPEFSKLLSSDSVSFTMPAPTDSNIILQFRMVSYGSGQHLMIARDITQQSNTEAMRKNFVDNVSHELRTPLTVLKGYLETLQDMDDGQSSILTQSFEQMTGQTERMQYLVDDLLLLARLETQKKKNECVDVVNLIQSICSESQVIEKNNSRIELQFESKHKIYGEQQDLLSAFSNLIVNALKYSENDKPIVVIWKQVSKELIFEVVDQGEGISTADIPRITERFYRVNVNRVKKQTGTGLGLAIVKHVVLRHDAQLKITSQVGKGSRFQCVFPAERIC